MTDSNSEPKDPEVHAISKIVEAFEILDDAQRKSVIEYVLKRYKIGNQIDPIALEQNTQIETDVIEKDNSKIIDIRSLKQQKDPKSANEMAALVAYYLRDAAPVEERKSEIGSDEIDRYFKLAPYPLPRNMGMILPHAKNAGYLDKGSSSGKYRLNSIGYNLIVHSLPNKTKKQKKSYKKKKK